MHAMAWIKSEGGILSVCVRVFPGSANRWQNSYDKDWLGCGEGSGKKIIVRKT